MKFFVKLHSLPCVILGLSDTIGDFETVFSAVLNPYQVYILQSINLEALTRNPFKGCLFNASYGLFYDQIKDTNNLKFGEGC